MESLQLINIKRNNSIIYKNTNLFNLDSKKKEDENLSFKHRNTQSDSTTAEEKKSNNNIKKSFSQKNFSITKINLTNVNNFNNEKNINFISKKVNKTIKKKNSKSINSIFVERKEESLKINNNAEITNGNFISNNHKNNKVNCLKSSPSGINCLHDYKYGISNYNNYFNKQILIPKLPNVFINHLLFKNDINTSEDFKSLPISITKRIKSKNLTILYYRPIKNF